MRPGFRTTGRLADSYTFRPHIEMTTTASVLERIEEGKKRREIAARQAHAHLHPKERKFDPIAVLLASGADRVRQLLPVKYARMKVSPFAFFRGAVSVMAADLARLPNSGIHAQLCGDAHVQNLGSFAAPDGKLVFDLNDFDETIRGPFEWDLKRMAASLVLAGCATGHKKNSARKAAEYCTKRYAEQMRAFARMPQLDVNRYQVHRLDLARPVHEALAKAERATPQHSLERLTTLISSRSGSHRRFKELKPMLFRVTGARAAAVVASLGPYREMLEPQRQHLLDFYKPVDVAFKVVGTGSVGLRDYSIHMEGNGPGDPLFLQIKEEVASAYAPYLPDARPNTRGGRRAAEGQRFMQIQTDPFLGWTHIGNRHYLVRQLNDHKGSITIEDLAGANLKAYAEVCGELLARGHARSGDAQTIAGYIGSGDAFAEAIAEFGIVYAAQTEKDWEELKRSGRAKKKA